MQTTHETRDDLILGYAEFEDETITADLTGTAGSVTDTTTYPVVSQATNTEKVTVDGGTEQTVTFTDAFDRGRAVSSNEWPLSTQDTLTEKVTIDGGSEQTVTFSGAITTAAQAAAQMDAQLTGCSVVVVGTDVVIYSDSQGASSSVAIGTGTTDMTWETPDTCNTAADIAAQMNAQLTGCTVEVSSGQTKITSDTTGLTSSVAIGTGTCDLTWDTAVAGTGQSAIWPKGTLLARNTSTEKMSAYADGGSNGLDEPVAVLPHSLTFAASGDLRVRVLKKGTVNKDRLSKLDDATDIGTLVFDKLIKNTGIIPQTVRDLTVLDNE